MLPFMDFVQNAFYDESNWNRDNSYGTITATSRNLLDFDTPNGLRFHVSALSSPNFASSYTLGSVGVVDGSLSYLYSSLPLKSLVSNSRAISLRHLVPGYRILHELHQPDDPSWREIWHRGMRVDTRGALLYGRLFLPRSTLEALYLRRLSPTTQLKISSVSDSRLPHGGTVLLHLSHDTARHSTEYIYSTDSALLGIRGLYNFGPPPSRAPSNSTYQPDTSQLASSPTAPPTTASPAPTVEIATPNGPYPSPSPNGRLSLGAELYYGLLNKSGGASTGLRFTTLPSHQGFPYTMTLTLNPLMGNLSSTYSVVAGKGLALSSRFDFNVYSYESGLVVGMELWRRRRRHQRDDLGWAREKMGFVEEVRERGNGEVVAATSSSLPPLLSTSASPQMDVREGGRGEEEGLSGCLKTRLDQRGGLGVLWEGRTKELLYSVGMNVDLRGAGSGGMWRGVGMEVCYSS